MKKKKWLITGGAGYIGRELSGYFDDRSIDYLVLDDLSTGLMESVRKENFLFGSICDQALLKEVFQNHEIYGVVHLAAKKDVGEAELFPELYRNVNVEGTRQLKKAASEHGVSQFIFASTAAAYEISRNEKLSGYLETDRIASKAIYGMTKILGENLLLDDELTSKMKITILRFFNIAGATVNTGWDSQSHNLIPKSFNRLINGLDFEVYGNDFPTPDGTCVRDYLHVSDLCEAIVRCIELQSSGKIGSLVLNIGTGHGSSVFEVMKEIQRVSGSTPEIKILPRRNGDPSSVYANVFKATQLLGWSPQFNLNDIIESSWTSITQAKKLVN